MPSYDQSQIVAGVQPHGRRALKVASKSSDAWLLEGQPNQGRRVLLINPWQSYPRALASEFQSYLPLGLAMLAAALEQSGARVHIIDCLAHELMLPAGDKVRFGLPPSLLAPQIAAFQPEVVGITNPFSAFIDDALQVARLVKSVDPTAQVVLGGIEPSLSGRNTSLLAAHDTLDVLVKGEGELTIVDLVAHYEPERRGFTRLDQVAGILFRSERAIKETGPRAFLANLDALPLPAYHLLDIERMLSNRLYARNRGRRPGVRCMPIHTSRGCPYSCNFCSVHSQVGKAHRRHSPAYVARHMQHLMQSYGVRHFHFEDDNLTLHPQHTRDLLSAVEPLQISWDTPNGVRVDTIDGELARLMARSGAVSVTVAVESGDQGVLDEVVNKRLALEDVISGVSSLQEAGIPTATFFIIGFPGEREEHVRRTLRFARRLALEHDTTNLLFVATPLPGTPLSEQCKAKGYLLREQNNESLLAAIRLNQMPLIATEDFDKERLFRWAKEELDVPGLYTVGQHIPTFFSSSPRARRNFEQFTGSSLGEQAPASYWQHAHNAPPLCAIQLQRAS